MPALGEVRAFSSSDEGARWELQWYQQITDLIEKAETAPTDEEAERYLDMLLWYIVDSGPVRKGFSPSIEKAADAMQRRRKKHFKSLRIIRGKNEIGCLFPSAQSWVER
jgi:hypothetical protein